MLPHLLLGLSVTLQLVAGGLALRLGRTTGQRPVWAALSAAFLLIAARRGLVLERWTALGQPPARELYEEALGFLASVSLLVALLWLESLARVTRRSEERLRESEERYSSLFENNHAAMLLIDPDTGEIRDANPAACSFYGFPRGKLSSLRIWEINDLPPDQVRAEMGRAGRQERRHFLFRHRLASGEVRDVEVYSGPIRVRGRPLLYSIIHDVTERTRAERERDRLLEREQAARREAEESRSRAALLAEVGALLSTSLDYGEALRSVARLVVPGLADWCTIDVSEDGDSFTRVSAVRGESDQTPLVAESSVPHPPAAGDDRHPISRVLHSGLPEIGAQVPEGFLERLDLKPEHLDRVRGLGPRSYLCVPLLARGRRLGVLSLLSGESGRDYGSADLDLAMEIARRSAMALDNARLYREAQEARAALASQAGDLERSNTDLEQFAYVASHDLREPLRMVRSYSRLLAERYQGRLDSKADDFLGFIVDGVTRMEDLIAGLLAYSRVGTRGRTFQPVECDAVLERALLNLRTAIEESGATVTHDPLPRVMGDTTQIGQVLQNLIGNALRFGGDSAPRVHVSAAGEGQEWVISVRDNGVGIAPEFHERIFQMFQRLHGPTEHPGSGMGLAICKRIVERHGGRIWVESRPGEGSVFCFTLPKVG